MTTGEYADRAPGGYETQSLNQTDRSDTDRILGVLRAVTDWMADDEPNRTDVP